MKRICSAILSCLVLFFTFSMPATVEAENDASLTIEQRAAADFYRDGTIDVKDLVAMKVFLGVD